MRRAFILGALGALGVGASLALRSSEAGAAQLPALDALLGESVNADANLAAFLAMIGRSEGAGYTTLYGGGTFSSFADHPRTAVTAGAYTSTAAGRYQILARTWDDFTAANGAHDFSPASQDACAVWLIRRRGALADVRAGRLEAAVAKCGAEWASLPGSPYGQQTRSLDQVRAYYAQAGGANV